MLYVLLVEYQTSLVAQIIKNPPEMQETLRKAVPEPEPLRGGRRSWLRALRAVPGGKSFSTLLSRLLGSLSILSRIPKMGASGGCGSVRSVSKGAFESSSVEPRGRYFRTNS